YWIGRTPLGRAPDGQWKTFPNGLIKDGRGGTATLKLAPDSVSARYLRVWMTESSNTCDEHGSDDIRNCVGYGIQSFPAGTIDGGGKFTPIEVQAGYTTSSIDPWHSSADVNATGSGQHSGFDVFFTSGLTNNLPAMIPVTMLYGTPDDAAAQIAYVKKRG